MEDGILVRYPSYRLKFDPNVLGTTADLRSSVLLYCRRRTKLGETRSSWRRRGVLKEGRGTELAANAWRS